MKVEPLSIDIVGLVGACSYALDCIEAELVNVKNKHGKRVAYISVRMAEYWSIKSDALQDLAMCALLHDNALTQYISEELQNHSDVYIKNNFTQRLFLKELAIQFALSPNYCCSLFTKTTGLTFSQYITKLRMEKALLLLQNPTLTINDIAGLTGYDDQIYFSKVFKKYYSLTPSQYRDKMISGGIQ